MQITTASGIPLNRMEQFQSWWKKLGEYCSLCSLPFALACPAILFFAPFSSLQIPGRTSNQTPESQGHHFYASHMKVCPVLHLFGFPQFIFFWPVSAAIIRPIPPPRITGFKARAVLVQIRRWMCGGGVRIRAEPVTARVKDFDARKVSGFQEFRGFLFLRQDVPRCSPPPKKPKKPQKSLKFVKNR